MAAPARSDDAPTGALQRILAIKGDPDYGAYLSGECTSCHATDGTVDAIPAIHDWSADAIATALYAYRTGDRRHQVMEMIAGRLGDEEIAALAAYFGALGND